MTGPTNCPNCGAPIGMDDRCSYCGTMFLDVSHIPLDEPFYLRIRTGLPHWRGLTACKVFCKTLTVEEAVDTAPTICMEFVPLGAIIVEELKTER